MRETVFSGKLRRDEGFNVTVGLEAIGHALDVVRDTACDKAEFDRFALQFLRSVNVTANAAEPEIQPVFGEPVWLLSKTERGQTLFEVGLFHCYEKGIRAGGICVEYMTKVGSKSSWNCSIKGDSAAVLRDGFLRNIMTGKSLVANEIAESEKAFDGLVPLL